MQLPILTPEQLEKITVPQLARLILQTIQEEQKLPSHKRTYMREDDIFQSANFFGTGLVGHNAAPSQTTYGSIDRKFQEAANLLWIQGMICHPPGESATLQNVLLTQRGERTDVSNTRLFADYEPRPAT